MLPLVTFRVSSLLVAFRRDPPRFHTPFVSSLARFVLSLSRLSSNPPLFDAALDRTVPSPRVLGVAHVGLAICVKDRRRPTAVAADATATATYHCNVGLSRASSALFRIEIRTRGRRARRNVGGVYSSRLFLVIAHTSVYFVKLPRRPAIAISLISYIKLRWCGEKQFQILPVSRSIR